MIGSSPRGLALIAVLVLGGPSLAGGPPDAPAQVPFPVERTTILREEKVVYSVEGRVRIPKGIEITVLRDVHVVGRGMGATIEVEGKLVVQGTWAREVIFEGVTIEPQKEFDSIRVGNTAFRNGGGIKTKAGTPCDGYFMLETLDFGDTAQLSLTMTGGSVELSTLCSQTPVVLKAVDTEGIKGNSVKVEIRGCKQLPAFPNPCPLHRARIGLRGGLVVEGANEVIVSNTRIAGDLTSIRDWRQSLLFDANKVNTKRLEFVQPAAGRFAKAQLMKCDVYSEKVAFSAPPARPGATEEAYFERWWFASAGDDKQAVLRLLEDGSAKPETNGVRARVGKLNEKAHELAGPVDR